MNVYVSTALSFLSGLALFLYGMRFMSDELERASGERLKKYFERISGGIVRSFFLGTAITALIQSSSATTVIVIGLLNAGIIDLTAACGVIIGANLGTTITSWILSLTEISSPSLALQLIDPEFFAPVIALIAIFTRLFAKKLRTHGLAGLLLGFSVLMIGMNLMTASLLPFETAESFSAIVGFLKDPVTALAIGIAITALIQSSSASVGILQALSITGMIPYSAVIPLVMGQNIGACATALLSSIGTNKNAKRAALIHLYYNVIGAIVISVLFYSFAYAAKPSFLSADASPSGIALTHTLFNLASTFLLLPFAKQLEKLAILSIPDKKSDKKQISERSPILDDRFLNSPALALSVSRDAFGGLTDRYFEAARYTMHHIKNEADERKSFIDLSLALDKNEEAKDFLREYLLRIDSSALGQSDKRELCRIINSLEELGNIGAQTGRISAIISQMRNKYSDPLLYTNSELDALLLAVDRLIDITRDAIVNDNTEKAHDTEPLVRLIEAIAEELKIRRTTRMISGNAPSEGLLYSELIGAVEKLALSCSALSRNVIKAHFGGSAFDFREYIKSYEGSPEFDAAYRMLKKRFSISHL